VAVVIAAAAATYFVTPSQTTVPIPEPGTGGNIGNGTGTGVRVLAQNLEVPWALDVAPDGRVFFTERAGKIRIIGADGKLIEEPAAYFNVEQKGESGLLGLALHPDFEQNHLLYIYHTYSNGTAVMNKVLMLTER